MPRKTRTVRASIMTWLTLLIIWITAGPLPRAAQTWEKPGILSARERAAVLNRITGLRLGNLPPKVMERAGFDTWLEEMVFFSAGAPVSWAVGKPGYI